MKCSKCCKECELVGGNWHEELYRCPGCGQLHLKDK